MGGGGWMLGGNEQQILGVKWWMMKKIQSKVTLAKFALFEKLIGISELF